MNRIHLTISSELFDEPQQEASLRPNLSVRNLIAEIQREFGLPEGNYVLYVKDSGTRPLDLDKTVEQLGVQTGAELIFKRERRVSRAAAAPIPAPSATKSVGARRMIAGSTMASLREQESGKVFEIRWQPAIIGRPEASNPASADALAVNLGNFEEARTVSRQQAQITERNGTYYLESLSERNLTVLNGDMVNIGERRALKDGDVIQAGRFNLIFELHHPATQTTVRPE